MTAVRRSQSIGSNRNPRRRGSASLYFLAFMFVTVPGLLLALNIWRITEAKVAQQRYSDAASLAAAGTLTDEVTTGSTTKSPLLYGDPTEIQNLCVNRCTLEAQNYAGKNYVDGMPLLLDTSTVNKDVKFGAFDFNAATPTFTPINPATASTLERRAINAVRVEAFRTGARSNAMPLFGPTFLGPGIAQIVTRTTTVLDRRVIGFRIQDNLVTATYQTVPLAPVALLSESDNPTAPSPADPRTWEYGVERDANPADGSTSPINYHTMIVNVPTSLNGSLSTLNSKLLDIGAGSVATLSSQLLSGLTKNQMSVYTASHPDGLILDKTNLTVNVPELSAPDPTMGSDFNAMLTAFQTLRTNGTERAWPLYKTTNGSNVVVTGFVAARIIDVSTPMDAGNSFIRLELQPTLMATPTAFTDTSNRFLKTATPPIANSGPPSPFAGFSRLVNPYICRVRMVD